jgi:hypothetical protein
VAAEDNPCLCDVDVAVVVVGAEVGLGVGVVVVVAVVVDEGDVHPNCHHRPFRIRLLFELLFFKYSSSASASTTTIH